MTRLLLILNKGSLGCILALLLLVGCTETPVEVDNTVHGCLDSEACNYNSDANIDNNSCWYNNDDCTCEDEEDSEIDECGVCDADTTNDCTQDECGEWGGSGLDEETEVELWGECYNIEETTNLNLYYNQLTGEIPQEVCDLIESNNLGIDNILTGNDDLINTCDD